MKIRELQVRTVVAPLDPPVRTASGHVTQAPIVLIDLATDTGVTGRSYLLGYHAVHPAPLASDDYRGAAEVAAQAATPIQIGENFNGVHEMELALSLRASDLVMPDPQQIGGVTGWLRAAALAQAAGVPCSSHLFIEVSAHLLAVTPTRHYIEYLDVATPILAEPLRPVDGAIEAPARPGIGLQWNEDAVTRYRVE